MSKRSGLCFLHPIHLYSSSLLPGDCLLYTEFEVTHTYFVKEVKGYTDYYINGQHTSTVENSQLMKYKRDAGAYVEKVVTVSKPGD